MISKRYWSYIISFILGLAYFLIYIILYSLLVSTSWLLLVEVVYFILAWISIIGFFTKDILDEMRIQRAKPSIGTVWMEHSPLAIMVLLQLIISLILNINSVIITKIVLSILLLIDIGWDFSQHIRSKSHHEK